jgi:uncharacterized membrane protein required for colicin V production
MTWVDAFVVLTLAAAFWGGYRAGAVRESVVVVSAIIAALAAGSFAGSLASWAHASFHLAPASAHLACFLFLFLLVFVLVRVAGWAADRRIAHPVLRVASSIGGGLVACAKAVLVLWLALFIGLFFPLAPDVRSALRASPSVRLLEKIDIPVYGAIIESLPGRDRLAARFLLNRHHL